MAAVFYSEGSRARRNGSQGVPSIRNLLARPFTPCQHGAQLHGAATWEERRAGRLRAACERAARAGAPCWRGTSQPRVRVNSDLSRKLVPQCTALCVQDSWDSWQEPPNSDPPRKVIVTSHARSKAVYQDVPGEFLIERSDLVRGSPANRNIVTGCCRVRGWSRRGCGQYRPPTQGIVTAPASNRDPSRKVIVTPYAGNSDHSRKVIVTPRARNSDHSRKRSSRITCKTAYFPGSNPASLLCVCMFYVPDVYRKGGGGWG